MLQKNIFMILLVLQDEGLTISTGDLADLTRINYKNIGRYLNYLETKDLIFRYTLQDKKKRFIFNGLTKKGEKINIPDIYKNFID